MSEAKFVEVFEGLTKLSRSLDADEATRTLADGALLELARLHDGVRDLVVEVVRLRTNHVAPIG